MTKVSQHYENISVSGSFAIKDGSQSTGRILTSNSTGRGTWSDQSILTGGTGGVSAITIANTVFVSKNGSDSTGVVERLDLPFSSITAATTAALAYYTGGTAPSATNRILIKVFSGNYTERIVLRNYVDYDLTNCILDLQSGANYTIDDNNVACNSIIYGNATIKRSTAGTLGCVRTQHSATTLNLNANNIIDTVGGGVVCTNGTQNINCLTISSSAGIGAYAVSGIQNINCLTISSSISYGALCTNARQTIHSDISSTYIDYGVGLDGTGTQIIYGNISSANATAAGCAGSGTQTIYGNIDAPTGDSNNAAAGASSGIQTVYGNCSAYGPSVANLGGTQYIHGDCLTNGGSSTVYVAGGTTHVLNSRLTNTNSNEVCYQVGGVLSITNCTLLTNGAASVAAGSTIKVYGTCQANKTASGATQQVGAIIVSTNVV